MQKYTNKHTTSLTTDYRRLPKYHYEKLTTTQTSKKENPLPCCRHENKIIWERKFRSFNDRTLFFYKDRSTQITTEDKTRRRTKKKARSVYHRLPACRRYHHHHHHHSSPPPSLAAASTAQATPKPHQRAPPKLSSTVLCRFQVMLGTLYCPYQHPNSPYLFFPGNKKT